MFGPQAAVGIITIWFTTQNVCKISFFWRHIDWRTAWQMVVWSLPGAVLGAWLIHFFSAELFTKILAVTMILLVTHDLLRPRLKNTQTSFGSFVIFGLLYGFLSGFVSTGNLVKGPFLVRLGLSKESYTATNAVTALAVNIPKLTIYSATGLLNMSHLQNAIPLVILSIFSTALGRMCLQKIPVHVFTLVLQIGFLVSAVFLLFS